MRGGQRGQPLLVVLGGLAWLVAALPVALAFVRDVALPPTPRLLGWAVASALFGGAYAFACSRAAARVPWGRAAALAVEALATLAMTLLVPSPFSATPLVVVAAQLCGAVAAPIAWWWIGLQSAALLAVMLRGMAPELAVTTSGAFFVFQLFAHHTASVAAREARGREELAAANAELLATRDLLRESSRLAERARIAGELHDVLGHHLTALSLDLEAALHLPPAQAREPVARARSVARLLLSDVRGLAGEMREDGELSVSEALSRLLAGVSRPRIEAHIPADLRVADAACAQALLRCVQETVTNAMRHSGADLLTLVVEPRDGGIAVEARDDGRGAATLVAGNGLRGMRERIESVGGSLEVRSALGEGLAVRAWVPTRVPDRVPPQAPDQAPADGAAS